MSVLRIVANLPSNRVEAVAAFYRRLLGLENLMDHGWIVTLGRGTAAPVQLSIASDGGGGAPVPALSVEVDDIDAAHARALEMGAPITYPLTEEDWGVRRFFVADPDGRDINILMHL